MHRDVKPSNVLLGEEAGEERTYLADFGLARATFSDIGALTAGIVGTVGYVSPEQIRGEPVDHRTDVYALGCLLHECLTGRLPFARRDALAILWGHLRDDPQPPSVLVPTLPRELDEVVGRALMKQPDERFRTAGELAQAARDAMHGSARPDRRAPHRAQLPAGLVTLFRAQGLCDGERAFVAAACAAENGIVVETQGDDTVLAAFEDAEDALRVAVRVGLRARVGIHRGTPHATSRGYVGADVDHAARVADAAHRGQVLLSASAAESVDPELLQPLGAHRLHGTSDPEPLHQLGDVTFPPLKTAATTNLPLPESTFLGRDDVLEAAERDLTGTRMLSVVGSGGAGKTRFALELARRLRDERFADFTGGVFACFLASLRDPTLVLSTIARALSVPEKPGRSALAALTAQIGDEPMLLMLDNVEHLLPSTAELEQLLAACPRLVLLATSRERLNIDGEQVFELPPLGVQESVALFCERADCEPSEPVNELCAHLEGLPLAVELAAARMTLLSPEQLLLRLSRRLDLLKADNQADPRQQTLRATIEWSFDLLEPSAQTLFTRLSVFAGGCTLEAAEVVCDAEIDALEALLDKHLVRRAGERYSMLETIREYASERLDRSGEAAELERLHGGYFLAFAEEAEPNLRWSGSPGESLRRLLAEQNNLRVAFDGFAVAGESQFALQLAAALSRFWVMTGQLAEGRRRLESALVVDDAPTRARGRALNGLAVTTLGVDAAVARRSAAEAFTLNELIGESWGAAYAAFLHGQAAALAGDPAGAERVLADSLERFRELGDDHYILLATDGLAGVYDELGDLASARPLHEENLARARAQGNRRIVALSLDQLASYARNENRIDEALTMLRESLVILRELDDLLGIGENLGRFARVFAVAGQPETAAQLLASLETLYEETGVGVLSWVAKMNAETLATIREQLDAPTLAAETARGRALTVDDAVTLALGA